MTTAFLPRNNLGLRGLHKLGLGDLTPNADGCECGELGGVCATCYSAGTPLPTGCDNFNDLLSIACHPELHGSFELPTQSSPCSGGDAGWVLPNDGSQPVWCGPGPQPASLPAWWNPNGTLFNFTPTTITGGGQAPAGGSGAPNMTQYTAYSNSGGILAIPTSVSITNVSRPGQNFQVGDKFQVIVKGGPNLPVTDTAFGATTPYGNTDSTGTLVITGIMDASTVGNWNEVWQVGNGATAGLSFTVSPASSTQQGQNQQQQQGTQTTYGSNSGGGQPVVVDVGGNPVIPGMLNTFENFISNLSPMEIGLGIGGVVLIGFMMMHNEGGRYR